MSQTSKRISFAELRPRFRDGMSILFGGFLGVGTPDGIVRAILDAGVGAHQLGEVAHLAVGGTTPGPAVDEESGGVARLDRRLGDRGGGQVVVELGGVHGTGQRTGRPPLSPR